MMNCLPEGVVFLGDSPGGTAYCSKQQSFPQDKAGEQFNPDSNPITRIATHTRRLHRAFIPRSIQKTVIYNRLLTEPDTRCRAMMKEGECHVTRKTKRILAYVPGLQRKNENQGPERYHVGELSSVLPEMQSCNESRLRKIEYGVERRSRRINAEPAA